MNRRSALIQAILYPRESAFPCDFICLTRERIASLPEDDWRGTKNLEFQEPRLSRNLKLVEQLRAIGARHGRSPGEVAIAWTLRMPAVTGAIVGARRPSQVDGFIGAADFRLSGDEIEEIERVLSHGGQAWKIQFMATTSSRESG
jgi:aryl-alcohol dehydrogenase-like predicted oxidoreductase